MNCLAQRKKFKNKHPVWKDPADDGSEPEVRDDHNPQKPEEPEDVRNSESEQSDDDDLEMFAADVRSKKNKLNSKELQFKHLLDLNNERSFNGGIQRVQFHPKSKIALVGLRNSMIDLFEVDGERNLYIQNISIPKTNQPFCSFTPDGNSIVISSEDYNGKFFTYDMLSSTINKFALKIGRETTSMTDFAINEQNIACRKNGNQRVNVLSSKTYENIFSVKINEPVKVIKFLSDKDMFIAGENSKVYIWDVRNTSTCKHKFHDEGAVHISSMSISEMSKMLSIGSDSGVVNSYELESCIKSAFPTPIRTFMNLKTPIDILDYNPTGELLLMGSKKEAGAFRMVHSHSGIVYKNFPQSQKRYGHLLSMNFSPRGGYLALGSSTGRAYLCRIPYYISY